MLAKPSRTAGPGARGREGGAWNGLPLGHYQGIDRFNYATHDGESWDIQVVDTKTGCGCSLDLDSNDRPHASYIIPRRDLWYAHWDGSNWHLECVQDCDWASGSGTDYVFYGSSLAVDSADHPHIAYHYWHQSEGHQLRYASWDGSAWQFEAVEVNALPLTGIDPHLRLDSNDNPCIAYHNHHLYQFSHLKYATRNGTSWDVELVASNGWGPSGGSWSWCDLFLDAEGNPNIAQYDGGGQYLLYHAGGAPLAVRWPR